MNIIIVNDAHTLPPTSAVDSLLLYKLHYLHVLVPQPS